MDRSEFYIGWQPGAPQRLASYIRKVLVLLIILVVAAAVTLGLLQKKFFASSFEFGQQTEITGVYRQFPVPSVKVMTGSDASGHTAYITMPLVGYGKSGAEGIIRSWEKKNKISLDGREVTLKGTLIYHDGKTLLQVDEHDGSLIRTGEVSTGDKWKPVVKEIGTVQLTGEILDPKCYFGVMKPGHGKPHRDCAIRCIAGGISPVFCVKNENGELDYYLLLDKDGQKPNDNIKDNVAEPVSLTAKAVRYDDWVVLYADISTIKRTGGLSWFKTNDISCGKPK